MLDKAEWVLLGVALAAAAYPVLLRVLANVAQPWRLEMADLEDELLASDDVSKETKDFVKAMTDLAFDWRPAFFMAFTAPIIVPLLVWRRSFKKYGPRVSEGEMRPKFDRFVDLSIRSDFAANPIFAGICWIEFKVLGLILKLFGKVKWQRRLFITAAERSERMFCGNHS